MLVRKNEVCDLICKRTFFKTKKKPKKDKLHEFF